MSRERDVVAVMLQRRLQGAHDPDATSSGASVSIASDEHQNSSPPMRAIVSPVRRTERSRRDRDRDTVAFGVAEAVVDRPGRRRPRTGSPAARPEAALSGHRALEPIEEQRAVRQPVSNRGTPGGALSSGHAAR
jgi:hypothetical protein